MVCGTFGNVIRLLPLERQKEVIDVMRDELDPPSGVKAELAGLPVLAASVVANAHANGRRRMESRSGRRRSAIGRRGREMRIALTPASAAGAAPAAAPR